MNIQEDSINSPHGEIFSFLKLQPQLFFIDPFLTSHPKAELFLVGGAVRDFLLAKSGSTMDFDFVIRGLSAQKTEDWFQKHGSIEKTGQKFDVFKFMPTGFDTKTTSFIDIALPRTESPLPNSLGGYRDFESHSDPFLPIEDDLVRRDFTINAMAFNLRTDELIDPFLGKADLKSKTLRAVGNPSDRFHEDLTRILRGIRFASQLDFTIEPHTWNAMKRGVKHLNRLRKCDPPQSATCMGEAYAYVVAREVIGDELSKAFAANPGTTARLLLESGVLEELFPSVWHHVQVNPHHLDSLYKLSAPSKKDVVDNQLEQAVILLLRGLSEDEAKTTLSSTGLDTIEKTSPRRIDQDRVLWVLQKLSQTHTPDTIANMRASQFEKQFMSAHGKIHTDILKHLGNPSVLQAIQNRHTEICKHWDCEKHEIIPALISGEDITHLGIPEGPRVRELLESVRDHQLDGHILTREAAIKFVKTSME
ncbi:MAG: hypothetical protein AAB664_01245 [Patescibacteria group bacterium]